MHLSICEWIKIQYPSIIFTSDPSGLRLPIGQAMKLARMRSGSKLPDIWIPEPAGQYHGLFLEVKAETPFKKDGTLYANEHIKEQAIMIGRLEAKGYRAMFVWSLEQAIIEVRKYLKNKV